MSIVIKRSNNDLIWFDTVLSFSRSFTGSVTKHPIEDGSTISDHKIQDNPVLNLAGVISNADFHTSRPILNSEARKFFDTGDKGFFNNEPVLEEPLIGAGPNRWASLLPESLNQFVPDAPPEVQVFDQRRTNFVFFLETILRTMERNGELFQLLDLDGRIYNNCVIVALDFTEDADSGDAIYPVMTIEVLKFVPRVTARLPNNAIQDVSDKAASKDNKGKQTTTSEGIIETDNMESLLLRIPEFLTNLGV